MQKTMGSSRREVAVRLSQRSIGEGRRDKIPDVGATNIDEDGSDASLLMLMLCLLLVLFDADPQSDGGSCECSGEFAGCRCSSSDACPVRSNLERVVMGSCHRSV